MSDDFEEQLLTDGGKWWEFLDPETYDVKEDLPAATRSSSDKLDWSRIEEKRPGPVGFAFFNHCSDCGQGVPPDFTFCVHCGGDPRSTDRPETYSVVIAGFEGEGRESAVELFVSAGTGLEPDEVDAILDAPPAVFNVTARRDQAAALVAKLAEVGIQARTFPVDDPSIPWIQEAVESIARQTWKLAGMMVVLLSTIAVSYYWSLFFLPIGLLAIGAFIVQELRWYRSRYHVDVRRLLELLTGFDAETARIARETLRNLGDREVRKHVTVCLMEYYTLTQQIRSHDAVYGGVLQNARFALEELMADVLTLAHRYGKLDAYVASHPPARLEQKIEDLRVRRADDRHAAEMIEKEIAVLHDQLEQVRKMDESRRAFRERLGTLARSMEQIRNRIATVRARASRDAWTEIGVDDALRELEQEFEVFEETFAVVR
jgi:hypothetical protein